MEDLTAQGLEALIQFFDDRCAYIADVRHEVRDLRTCKYLWMKKGRNEAHITATVCHLLVDIVIPKDFIDCLNQQKYIMHVKISSYLSSELLERCGGYISLACGLARRSLTNEG